MKRKQPHRISRSLSRTAAESAFDVPAPNINLANPLVVSQNPKIRRCAPKSTKNRKKSVCQRALGRFRRQFERWRVVCSLDGRKLFNPASIQKTLTAIVALDNSARIIAGKPAFIRLEKLTRTVI
jgi:hypothetical protein